LLSANGFAQFRLKDIKIDERVTGFKFATYHSTGIKVYFPNGKSDLKSKLPVSTFSVGIKDGTTFDGAKDFLGNIINKEVFDGAIVSKKLVNDTTINGSHFYEITLIERYKQKESIVFKYYAFTMKENSSIFFLGFDFEGGINIKNYKETFRTLKIK